MNTGVFADVFTKQSLKRPQFVAECLFWVRFRGLRGVGLGTVCGLFGDSLGTSVLNETVTCGRL